MTTASAAARDTAATLPRARIAKLPAAFFGAVPGLVGLGLAWRSAELVFGVPPLIGELILALGAAAFYIAKILRALAAVLAESMHPGQIHPYRPARPHLQRLFQPEWRAAGRLRAQPVRRRLVFHHPGPVVAPPVLGLPFAVSWWAYTFPLDAMTSAALAYHAKIGRPASGVIAAALLSLTSAVVAVVSARTGLALQRGELFGR